jgi:hypothetical protein
MPQSVELTFGLDCHWSFHSPHEVHLLNQLDEAGEEVRDVVGRALSRPIDFPSFDQAIVPGDHVALVIDPELPSISELISAVAKWLCAGGMAPGNLRCVLAGQSPTLADRITKRLQSDLSSSELTVEPHDPNDSEKLAYVAASQDADPIYINRTLVDADVVIPVSCARPSGCLDYFGGFDLFPLITDATTRNRFYSLSELDDPDLHRTLITRADEAGRWLGALVAMQIIPAASDRVAGAVAGLVDSVEKEAQAIFERLFHSSKAGNMEAAPGFGLVIATIEAHPDQQSWLEVSRALHAAARLVAPGGTIAVLTELAQSIGKGLQRLEQSSLTREELARKLDKDAYEDAFAAAVLNRVTADHHVYLAAKLPSDTLEGLGLGVLKSETQLNQLACQFDRTLVLRAAQHYIAPTQLQTSF